MFEEVQIDELGGYCPVQGNGFIDGVPFYFRARGDAWRIEIGPGNTHLVVEAIEQAESASDRPPAASAKADARAEVESRPVWRYEESYGQWPDAGWMSTTEARAFIEKAASLWRSANSKRSADGVQS